MVLKGLKQKILNEYLERNMSILDYNIKIDNRETIFSSRLISAVHLEQILIIGNVNAVILHMNGKCIEKIRTKKFRVGTFHKSHAGAVLCQ
jgi:hypothetical protein